MAEKRKIYRVSDSSGTLVQQLPETSADQVTVADAGNKLTATNVEDALQELASGVASAGKVDDVQDVNGSSIVTNKIAKLTKAAVGLGNVDNTADANKSVKHATSADSATTATSATTANSATKATQDASGNVITSTYATKTELQEGLAGKSQSKTYNNYQAFVTAVNAMNNTALKVGDNVFIVTADVPDMWVSAVNSSSASYTYSSDSAIVTALGSTNGLTVGYYVFRKLETQKVDLTAYQTKTDNSLNTTSKTVVGAINEVKSSADSALSKANTNATSITNITNGTTKVGKAGTADNATNVTTNINGKAISDIFESNGTTVKNATHATGANTANEAQSTQGALSIKGYKNNSENILVHNGGRDETLSFEKADFVGTASSDSFSVNLASTGVTAGTYSALTVDAKGRATAGGQMQEYGTSGQTKPSASLAVNGTFWQLV